MRTSKKLLALCLILTLCCLTVIPAFSWYDRSTPVSAGKFVYEDEYNSAGYNSNLEFTTYTGHKDESGHNIIYDKKADFSDTNTVTLNAETDNTAYYKTVIKNNSSSKAKFNLFLKSLYTYKAGSDGSLTKNPSLSDLLYVGTTNPIYNKQAYPPKYADTTADYNKFRIYFTPGVAWQGKTTFYLCYFDAIEDRDYIKMTLAGDMASGNKIYFQPGSEWESDGARMAAYFFGNGNKWVSMSDSDNDGIYECDKPSGYTQVIFCRMNGSNSTNNWDNCYNQTNDLTLIAKNCFKITQAYVDHDNNAGTAAQGRGEWLDFNTDVYYADIPEDSHGFYVTHSDDKSADGNTRTPSIFFNEEKNKDIMKGYPIRLTGGEVDATYHNMAYNVITTKAGIAVNSYFDMIYGDVNASGVSVKLTQGTHFTGATASYSASGSQVSVNSSTGAVTLKEAGNPTITTTLTSPFGDKLPLKTEVRIVDPRVQVPVVENISIEGNETLEICWFIKNDTELAVTYSIGGISGSL